MSDLSTIVSFLESKGLPNYIIAGIVGNMKVETGGTFSPTAYNPGEQAIGLVQWEGGRRTALQQFAAAHGGSEKDLQIQLEFLWHEMHTSESSAFQTVMSASNAAQAASLWDQYYERSAGTTRQERIDGAVAYMSGNLAQTATGADRTFSSSTDSSGGGGGGHPSTSDYSQVDGGLGNLLTSVPELRQLLNQAQANDWSVTKFENAVENSDWYKQHSETARSAIIQRANDPASWQQSLNNTISSLTSLSHQLGMPLTDQEAHAIAVHALFTGEDSNQQWLTEAIGRRQDYTDLKSTDNLRGGMAATSQQLQQLAADYGVNWSPAQIAQKAANVVDGTTTIDTYRQQMIAWAKSAFPGLARQLDGGQTVRDLADPYIQSMSNILEVDPGKLDVYTPMIRKALQGTVPQGGGKNADPTTIPLWQFEQQLRQDPRWQYTSNAHSTMSSALLQIGSIFGFGPESSG